MAINYSIKMETGIPVTPLEYDEVAISRSGDKVTMQFYKDGEALFSEDVYLTAEGEVFRISGLKGSVELKISYP